MNRYAWRWENTWQRKKLWAFIVGLSEDIDGNLTFDIDTLIANINILDGYPLEDSVKEQIKEMLSHNPHYTEVLNRCEPYKEAAKNGDNDALDFLNREMWLLVREYYDVIEKNYTETFFNSV